MADLLTSVGLTPAKEQKDWKNDEAEEEGDDGSDEDAYEKLDEMGKEAEDPGMD